MEAGGLLGANPESASAHWKLTVTGLLFQPLAFATADLSGLMLGAVRSILIIVDSDAVPPALVA